MKIKLFLIASILTSPLYAEDIYRWTDNEGITHYSYERPDNIPESKIITMDIEKQTQFVKSGLSIDELTKSAQEIELDRIIKKNCKIAKNNIKVLTSVDNVKQMNNKGELEDISYNDRNKQLSLARKQAALFCNVEYDLEKNS